MSGPDRAVVLAGGGGTRLWPWTGPERPKPLLPLGGGGRTLLRATLDRLHGTVPDDGVRVLAAPALLDTLARAETSLGAGRLWTEPAPRDTGPAVALAMRRTFVEAPRAVVAILPADHRVADPAAFGAALRRAAEVARDGRLVTLGVRPDHAATRFGYVVPDGPVAGGRGALDVRRFVEKPTAEVARALLAGGALWNGGIFVWRADVFWGALEAHAPDLAAAVAAAVDGDLAAWDRAPKISIDYALMERASGVATVPLDAGWDDVGGWDAVLPLLAAGDCGTVVRVEARGEAPGSVLVRIDGAGADGAVVLGETPLLVVIGPEGVLVAPRGSSDRVKAFV